MTTFRTYVTEEGNKLEGILETICVMEQTAMNIPEDLGEKGREIYLRAIGDVLNNLKPVCDHLRSCRLTSNILNGFRIREEDII